MIQGKKFYMRIVAHRCIGPGGWKCPCCAPAPGKESKVFFRTSKRGAQKRFMETYIKRELEA